MDIDSLIYSLENTTISINVSDNFMKEINYICNSVINYYKNQKIIYTDILDILSHLGHELAYDVCETFETDCKWFSQYGKVYVYNYILTRIQIETYQDYIDIETLINTIKDVYNI